MSSLDAGRRMFEERHRSAIDVEATAKHEPEANPRGTVQSGREMYGRLHPKTGDQA